MGNGRAEVFYFIKLPDKFLNGDQIRWVESQENGSEVVLFYFRLLIIAKNRQGKLSRIIGKNEIPYTIQEIATETYQTIEFVEKALKILEEAELLVYDVDHYFIEKSLELTNQTTKGAEYQKSYRARKKECIICNSECNTEIEEDEEIEKEIRKKNKEGEKYIEKDDFPYVEIIEYLNKTIGSNYKSNSKQIINLIKQHVNEGYEKEDFISVIDKKYKEWNDTEMSKYIRPETLFGDKFESYVNQKEKVSSMDFFELDSLYDNFDNIG